MPKQAVLLIHGIGEQRPMQTLRSFVHTVWTTNTPILKEHENAGMVWSKPYPLAQNFELRRLTTAENKAGLRTDFFELYWAHLMQGTKIGHVVAWARTLLLRWPSTVPRHLRLAYWVLIALVVVAIYLAYRAAAAKASGATGLPVWASLVTSLAVIPFATGLLVNVVGEAARYLHVAPANVSARQTIRAAGVRALKSLHNRDYERIIVVGHSLGSVIGYDILYHAWASFNEDQPGSRTPSYKALTDLEALTEKVEGCAAIDPGEIRRGQRAYFDEMKANQLRWRVSDFVTLGSPLAHAEILLARNSKDLSEKIEARELASCPPQLELTTHDKVQLKRFSYPPAAAARVPHHAAVFAPTSWTNLYFPCRLLFFGDLIGGPLSSIFGSGIRDVPVRTTRWFGLLSHTLYWTTGHPGDSHITALREALNLLDSASTGAPQPAPEVVTTSVV